MRDRWGRSIDYLRISVTDRCNLRCGYCVPAGGVRLLPQADLLTFAEIIEVARAAIALGFNKIRLTGGEPLLRSNVVELVRVLARLEGLADLSMTTNGVLLSEYAEPLFEAGLDRLNISLDAVDADHYRSKSGGGEVARVLAGIGAAWAAGFASIKLNCVVDASCDEPDARDVAAYAKRLGLSVRFIRRMNLATGEFWVVNGGSGGDCARCNRLRLGSDGLIRPCLFSDEAFSVRELGAAEALRRAIRRKPRSGTRSVTTTFSRIGG